MTAAETAEHSLRLGRRVETTLVDLMTLRSIRVDQLASALFDPRPPRRAFRSINRSGPFERSVTSSTDCPRRHIRYAWMPTAGRGPGRPLAWLVDILVSYCALSAILELWMRCLNRLVGNVPSV